MKSFLFFLLLLSLKFTAAQSPVAVMGAKINLDPCPPAPMVDNAYVCPNDTKTLTVYNPVPSYTYNWYDVPTGGSVLVTGTSFTTPVITANTAYYVEAVNGNCASVRTYVAVYLISTPSPIVHDTTICSGEFAILTILNPVSSNYNWYTSLVPGWGAVVYWGPTLTTPYLYQTTTYYVDGSVVCPGYRVPVVVTVIAPPLSNDVTVCPGNTATLTVQDPEANQIYNWYPVATGGNTLSTSTSFITPPVLSPTTYFVENTNAICNNLRTPVNVNLFAILDSPRVSVKSVSGNSVTFSWQPVAGAIGYKVSVDGSTYGLPSSGSMGTTHMISNLPRSRVVTISVIALGQHGCDDSSPGHSKGGTYANGFYIPSAFTPNGDGLNDALIPILPEGTSLDYFDIFNRWGQRLFSTKIMLEGWNGKFNGIDQSMGSYVWICKFHDIGTGEVMIKRGTFTIIH